MLKSSLYFWEFIRKYFLTNIRTIIYKRLITFDKKNTTYYTRNSLDFGKKKQHSTEKAIIDLVGKLTDAIDKNKFTACWNIKSIS